ncbi:unnamed protein product [Phaedon cochleariae]|uniref:Uncharacterized protein n=1 Tax=Phaedon cochleariae TaxID=80249 RepID=A0A9N9SA80_PHACE|nr:unnamed protein product [Phaedon cochleariae]
MSEEKSVFIPSGIVEVIESKGNYIHASIDNFDLNEETIDGKGTTHSMAMVVFQQPGDSLSSHTEIHKSKGYSLSTEDVESVTQSLTRYRKPPIRPEPVKFVPSVEVNRENYDFSKKTNLVWRVLRYINQESPFLSWTDYNNVISKNKITVSNIAYLPFLNAPPTEYDTIYTAMIQLVQLAEALNQKHIVITADLAIYSKAREIMWNKPTLLDGKVTLQLGGMHLTMALIASIGYIFGDGGLSSMLVETGIYAENSCKLMLDGKQYARSIRGLTLATDALSRLLFNSFLSWYEESNDGTILTKDLEQIMKTVNQELKEFIFNETNFKIMLKDIEEFETALTNFLAIGFSSATFKYWYSFIEAVDLLWKMLRAERDGDFDSHLCSVFDSLPYLTAAGRNLYSKWVPVYLNDMKMLKTEVPYMYHFLEKGNFVVKKTKEKIFNCVASDMALEQSINRDCKSSTGVIGFSRKPAALLRWLVTRHSLGDFSQKFVEATMGDNSKVRKDGQIMSNRNEADVKKIMSTIEESWCNPFCLRSAPLSLINICTGKIVDESIEKNLTTFLDTSMKKIQTQWNNFQNVSFWKPLKRDKIATFKETKIVARMASKGSCIGSELMFRRVICAARSQDMDLSNILSYELTSVPASLFNEDGSVRKTVKSELAKQLESFTESHVECENLDSVIIDGAEIGVAGIERYSDLGMWHDARFSLPE